MKKLFIAISALLLVLTGCSLFQGEVEESTAPPSAEVTEPAAESPAPAPPPTAEINATLNVTPPPAAAPTPQPTTPPPPPPAQLQPKVISLDVGNLFFTPKNLQLKLNQKVVVNYTNKGHHTFTVDGLGVDFALKDNDSGSFAFTPKKTGKFTLYCATPGHKAGGMVGTVTVTE